MPLETEFQPRQAVSDTDQRARVAASSPVTIVRAAPTILNGAVRREPSRPVQFRTDGFDDKYDSDTLFFDAFLASGGREAILVGPPFLNLQPMIEGLRIIAHASGRPCRVRARHLDRHAQLWASLPPGTERLAIESGIGAYDIPLRVNQSPAFAGKRVLFTLSKNNRLEWIQDWLRYHRDVHGANAVVFYDNASTRYSLDELAGAISEVGGLERAAVVAWPFRYGPQGLDAERFWDSDYCQLGAWEHARWCFLQEARSAMNADVDELVVASRGRSVFEMAERSLLGMIRYRGQWVLGIKDRTPTPRDGEALRHRDFEHVLVPRRYRRWGVLPRYEDDCLAKWTIVPSRCPRGAQWGVHRIRNWIASLPTTANASYRHFREINDNWKYDRSDRSIFDTTRHARDEAMIENFSRVNWHR